MPWRLNKKQDSAPIIQDGSGDLTYVPVITYILRRDFFNDTPHRPAGPFGEQGAALYVPCGGRCRSCRVRVALLLLVHADTDTIGPLVKVALMFPGK